MSGSMLNRSPTPERQGERARRALHRLYMEGRIQAEWLPGMKVIRPGMGSYRQPDEVIDPGDATAYPDLADPATAGALLPLAREAWGTERLSVAFYSSIAAWLVTHIPGEDNIESYVSDTDGLIGALERRARLVSL